VFSLKHHIVWCPKYPRPVLTRPIDARLKALFAAIAAEHGMTLHAVEVMPDHVQIRPDALCRRDRQSVERTNQPRLAARVPVSPVAIANTLAPQRLRGHGWRRLGEDDQRLYRSAAGR